MGYKMPPWPSGYGARQPGESAPSSEMRVSDAERHVIADALSQHFADGRLDQGEFDERMHLAMSAKTRGDLDGLLRDLPPLEQAVPEVAPVRRRRSRTARFAFVALLLLVLSNSWNWLFGWHGWGWGSGPRPHIGFLLLVLAGVMLFLRRRGWRRSWRYREPIR